MNLFHLLVKMNIMFLILLISPRYLTLKLPIVWLVVVLTIKIELEREFATHNKLISVSRASPLGQFRVAIVLTTGLDGESITDNVPLPTFVTCKRIHLKEQTNFYNARCQY